MDYTPDIYTLVDEDGEEHQFEMLDEMEIDGQTYFALIPYFEDPDESLSGDGDLIVLKSEIVDGEEMMASIDDDDEYEKVGNIFLDKLAMLFEEEELSNNELH